jgi:site-specific recombinase XerD
MIPSYVTNHHERTRKRNLYAVLTHYRFCFAQDFESDEQEREIGNPRENIAIPLQE